MYRRLLYAASLGALVGVMPARGSAQSGSAAVPTTFSIYLAGGNTYSVAPANGGGLSPFLVTLLAGTGRVLRVIATGTGSFCPGATCATTSPDGPAATLPTTNLNASGKISGIIASNSGFLAGVFLGPTLPSVAPATLNFGSLDFLTLSPLLGQQFFIGDGFTSTSVQQQFFIPDNAIAWYFGIADGGAYSGNPDFYGDNAGTYTARYDVTSTVPEPATLLLLTAGLLAMATTARRRRSM